MSRSGYLDIDSGDDSNYYNLYRSFVERSIEGKRGQAFLLELSKALDAMSDKKLIVGKLVDNVGDCCTIGAVCKARGIDVSKVDYEYPEAVGKLVGISQSMAAEIAYENDERNSELTPEQRWTEMRKWVDENLKIKEVKNEQNT